MRDLRSSTSLTGLSPLARHAEWYFVKCPRCGKQGRRETDVSDTFLDSSWYYLRYVDPNDTDLHKHLNTIESPAGDQAGTISVPGSNVRRELMRRAMS